MDVTVVRLTENECPLQMRRDWRTGDARKAMLGFLAALKERRPRKKKEGLMTLDIYLAMSFFASASNKNHPSAFPRANVHMYQKDYSC